MLLTLFTNDPVLAKNADLAGVDRIGLDLERIGKDKRQAGLNTWISNHHISELPLVRQHLNNAKLFVRTNSMHDGLKNEIDQLVDLGAEVLMLPFFFNSGDAERFIDMVDGRAQVSLLVETADAARQLADIIQLDGVNDIHIGLNDLHLSLGLSNIFEVLQSALMDKMTEQLRSAGCLFGFGGIGRYGDTKLPVPSDLIYAQYAYHGARSALVSRVFTSTALAPLDFPKEIEIARSRIDYWFGCEASILEQAHQDFIEIVSKLS